MRSDDSPPTAAELMHHALELLSRRSRSEAELTRAMARKGGDAETVEGVLERLRGLGYVDDAGLARRWVENRGTSRGRAVLAGELRRKGVDPGEALAQRTDDDEQAAAFAAAVRKVGESPRETDRAAQARLAAHLQRRGFGWGAIRPVLARLYSPSNDDSVEPGDAFEDES
ncbi:MAG: regulatory protein RecX [Armatimonadota bacterium]